MNRVRLDDVATILSGSVHERSEEQPPESLDMPRLVMGVPEVLTRNRLSDRWYAVPAQDDRRQVTTIVGDVVTVLSGPHAGTTALVGEALADRLLAHECAVVRVFQSVTDFVPGWLYAWTLTNDFRNQVERAITGAMVPRLTPRALRDILVPLLPQKGQKEMVEFATMVDLALVDAHQVVGQLEDLRETELDLRLFAALDAGGSR